MAKAKRSSKRGGGRGRRISVRGVRRESPDLRLAARALLDLAAAQAEADAEAEAKAAAKGHS
jgi:hypothetical protein